jgi:hypothetical protein
MIILAIFISLYNEESLRSSNKLVNRNFDVQLLFLTTIYLNQILYLVQCVLREDAFHFFFECSKYTDIRRDLLICVNQFRMKIDLALLTTGNQNLTYDDNCLIFKEVEKEHAH